MSLREYYIKSTSIMMLIRVVRGITIFITNLILARLLLPRDFGLASIAMSIITAISLLSDFGLGRAIIQKGSIDKDVLTTGANLRFIFSIFFCLLLFFSAPLFVQLYPSTEIVNIVQVCSIIFIVQSAGFIPIAVINIKLQFKKLLIPTLASNLSILISATIFALLHFQYWSIILSYITGAIVNVLFLWILFPWKLEFKIDYIISKELLNYGKYATSISFFGAVIINADRFVSGAFIPILALGYYSVAYTWGTLIVFNLSYIIAGVTFPSFSSHKNDIVILRTSFLNGLKYLYLLSFPLITIFIAFSKEFIEFFLGNIWIPSLQVFQLLLIFSLFYIIYFIHSDLLFALNEQKKLLMIHIIMMIVLLTMIYPMGIKFDISGIALTLITTFAIGSLIELYFSSKILNYSIRDLSSYVAPQLLCSISIGIILIIIKPLFQNNILIQISLIPLSLFFFIVLLKIISTKEYWTDIVKTYNSSFNIIMGR